MPSLITPPAVKPGATIAFISPSERLNTVQSSALLRARTLLSSKGYTVRTLFTADDGTTQSSINHRLDEIRTAFGDPSISAIICTIGGTAFTQLLPTLLADETLRDRIRAYPKVVVGASDMTGLHWFLHACAGLRTFYGPSAIPELGVTDSIEDKDSPLAFCVRSLFAAITDPTTPLGAIPRSKVYAPKYPSFFFRGPDSVDAQEVVPTPKWQWLRGGKAKGRLFGGCLTVVVRLNGIPAIRPDWRGRIVFLETSAGESRDLDLVQTGVADLIAQGVFEGAAGLVIGRPYGYDTDQKREDYQRVFRELLCEGDLGQGGKQFPILYGVDIGHTTPMVTLPYDVLASLDSDNDQFAILEAAVA
jgi:muramoyltetrapeptide carboxypeptidase LdcA involved in peptidoglycan recycling